MTKSTSLWQLRIRRFRKDRLAVVSLGIISILLISAILAQVIAPYDPASQRMSERRLPPGSPGHLLGTDGFGRDIASRLVYGGRISLMVGLVSVGVGMLIGMTLGLIAGYFKHLDNLIMRVMDILLAFPGVLIAIIVVAILGPGLYNVIIAISVFSIPMFARLTRGATLSAKEETYVLAARSLGAPTSRILLQHILPNIVSPIIVFATVRIGVSILNAAALSFLGIGAQPPMPEWGVMISEGRNFLYTSPYIAFVPGLAILIVVLSFNLLGDGIRDALDPFQSD
ncbi:MAG TPA: ABC transporter permease [Candidatus Acetothermia bacterium]|nr:ABC transporter permease [Candidatus Acetothermia bacterium]